MIAEAQEINDEASTRLPRSRFFCLLDEQPTWLVPARLYPDWLTSDHGPLRVNPLVWLSPGGAPPPEFAGRARHIDGLAFPHPAVWVDHPATRVLAPFWLGPEYFDLVDALLRGRLAVERLARHHRAVLLAAGVLVVPGETAAPLLPSDRELEAASRSFEGGYAVLGGLIHPLHVGALRRYYRYMTRQGAFTLGDGQSRRRYAAHNETVARYFHYQLAALVSRVAGVPVKPSYVYLVSYQSGAELKKHSDREQCEYSITLLIDHSPEPVSASPWPIHLHKPTAMITVQQAIGDGLLYRGGQIPHSRDPLPEGQTSTSLLFHYVDEAFSGRLS